MKKKEVLYSKNQLFSIAQELPTFLSNDDNNSRPGVREQSVGKTLKHLGKKSFKKMADKHKPYFIIYKKQFSRSEVVSIFGKLQKIFRVKHEGNINFYRILHCMTEEELHFLGRKTINPYTSEGFYSLGKMTINHDLLEALYILGSNTRKAHTLENDCIENEFTTIFALNMVRTMQVEEEKSDLFNYSCGVTILNLLIFWRQKGIIIDADIRHALLLGANFNKGTSFNGIKPLHNACKSGLLEAVKSLIDFGANINECDEKYGDTPLITAVINNHIKIVDVLVSAGADVNKKNASGLTPLSCAAANDYHSIASILICNGAEVNTISNKENTPLDLAAERNHPRLVELLLKSGATVSKQAIEGAKDVHIKTLLENAFKLQNTLPEAVTVVNIPSAILNSMLRAIGGLFTQREGMPR
jgi:ankyrin repeat protein